MGAVLKTIRALTLLVTALAYGVEQFRLARAGSSEPMSSARCDPGEATDGDIALGDDFLYDAVARMNEAVVSNIDTVDLALLAAVGGAIGVLIFGIDKVRELAPPWGVCAYWLLGLSLAACIVGYLIPFGSPREPIDPTSFTVAFTEEPDAATSVAIKDAVYAFNANVRIRFAKKICVVMALVSLVTGTAVIALARSFGVMI